MKAFAIICALLAVATAQWAPKTGKQVEQIRDLCITEEGVTGNSLEALKKFEYPDSPSVRCYMRCVAKNLGVWDEGSGLNPERVTKQIKLKRSEDAVEPGVVKCINDNKHRPDECTWIYREFKCMIDEGLLDVDGLVKS